tara:strand:+ start:1647 stop:2006 length:360 start_codon:yes stop_codon:yes gene_type:complete
LPAIENPTNLVSPELVINSASAAAPPDSDIPVRPDTLNWNPATSESKSYIISTCPLEAFPKYRDAFVVSSENERLKNKTEINKNFEILQFKLFKKVITPPLSDNFFVIKGEKIPYFAAK